MSAYYLAVSFTKQFIYIYGGDTFGISTFTKGAYSENLARPQ